MKKVHLVTEQIADKAVCGRGLVGAYYAYHKSYITCKACARVHKLRKQAARRRWWTNFLYY